MAKRYKCPYCNFSSERDKLIEHIGEEHEELIPEGYTPTRVVFNIVNKREYGVCMICKGKTEWNEKAGKYNKICPKESCHKAAREAFTKNMIKVYNKPTLLDDEDWQAHMLANRRISGKYKFSDGGSVTYTGSYEKKCLEFMDNVLNIPSKDIMCPGPTFEYEYMGNKHKWITDIYYIPANLVIEIKDGGNNPNSREMISYREKQIEKERMITNLGVYNYIRLTDNQFVQLIDILAELKEQAMNGEVSPISRINEAMGLAAIGGIANAADGDVFVGLYKSNTFVDSKDYEKMCLTKGMFDNDTLGIKDGILTNIALDENTSVALFKFVGNRENYKRLLEHYNKECSDVDIYEILSGNMMLSKDQIAYDKNFEFVDFAMPIINIESFNSKFEKINEVFDQEKYTDYAVNGTYSFANNHYSETFKNKTAYIPKTGLPIWVNKQDLETKVDAVGKPIYQKFWKNNKGYIGNSPFKFYELIPYNYDINNLIFSNIEGFNRIGATIYHYNFSRENRRYSVILVNTKDALKEIYLIDHNHNLIRVGGEL